MSLVNELDILKNGHSLEWKQLDTILLIAQEDRNPNGANQVMRTILELDGNIKSGGGVGNGGVTVVVNTGLPERTTKVITP